MKIILSLILILNALLCYSQLSIGIENTIRKCNLFPLGNEYPLEYEYIPSINCFNSSQKIDFGIKLGVIHHEINFNQKYNYTWGDAGSNGYQTSSFTMIYSSKLNFNLLSSSAFLRLKFGPKKRLYFSFLFGYDLKINEVETNHNYYSSSGFSTTILSGPYEGVYSSSHDSTNSIPFKGVESEKKIITANFGFGYIFQLFPKITLNTDASFGLITNQLIFYKPNDYIDEYSPENLNGSLFLSVGINYKFE